MATDPDPGLVPEAADRFCTCRFSLYLYAVIRHRDMGAWGIAGRRGAAPIPQLAQGVFPLCPFNPAEIRRGI